MKRPSLGKTIAKIAVGAIFVIIGLDDLYDLTFFLTCLVIGAALIAWGLIPYLQAVRAERRAETERILSTPFPKPDQPAEDEAEKLAKKYYNK